MLALVQLQAAVQKCDLCGTKTNYISPGKATQAEKASLIRCGSNSEVLRLLGKIQADGGVESSISRAETEPRESGCENVRGGGLVWDAVKPSLFERLERPMTNRP